MNDHDVAATPWAGEANRLLDAWSEAQAHINALHRRAAQFRAQLEAANERCREARGAFDQFMYGCMTMRADVAHPEMIPVECDCNCGTPCPQGKAGIAVKCRIMQIAEPKTDGA